MSWDKIVSLLREGEGPRVEFKKKLQNSLDLARDIVAFSNCEGGYIVLGIDDKNGHLRGETASKEWVIAVSESKCTPKVSLNVTQIDKSGRNILFLIVYPGKSKPYYADNICYIRDGAQTRKASFEEEDLLSQSNERNKDINERQKQAIQYVMENNNITNKKFRELFGVSHKTAHLELTDLVRREYLVVKGKGRSTRYEQATPE